MQGSEFDEAEFFRAIATSGARVLLIGRRALIALGIPVLTADYDFWLHIDDIVAFNRAVEPQGLFPTRTADEARGKGRYVLENDERVDVLVARTVPTVDGVRVAFDEIWERRRALDLAEGVVVAVPSLDDLILTKRFGGRPTEEEESRSLIRWFRRRYPTPAARLAYARRAYRRWQAAMPPAAHSPEAP